MKKFFPQNIADINKISVILDNKCYETVNGIIRIKVTSTDEEPELLLFLGVDLIYIQKIAEDDRNAFFTT